MSNTKNDLFDNPMINSARKAMTPEQKKRYSIIGEEMYNTIDFPTSTIKDKSCIKVNTGYDILKGLTKEMQEAVYYIKEGLKSGLLPTDLEDDEKKLLVEIYGEDWIDILGFKD